ncbi:hypothetical protein U9M48_014154 [Paspalum notatum var. saurae]|uniref:Sulfite exporter TauE/SafE family protein n=1 Tax=Paspalum notatum var. saurae TaxID=547442 RepID=A0AAQ3WKC1_PASNO
MHDVACMQPMRVGWRIVLGTLIGFFGAACGSVGGVGGGGIFVPMLALIVGFDPKSTTAISKCMIMGGSVSTVYYNLKLKHPTLDMPLIDYDLALLMQPMLMLGVSIGVIFNVIFPNWLITALLIILFLGDSLRLQKDRSKYVRGQQHKRVLAQNEEKALLSHIFAPEISGQEPEHQTAIPAGSGVAVDRKNPSDQTASVLKNVYGKEFGLLAFVWIAFLGLQITKVRIPNTK